MNISRRSHRSFSAHFADKWTNDRRTDGRSDPWMDGPTCERYQRTKKEKNESTNKVSEEKEKRKKANLANGDVVVILGESFD